VKDSKVPVTPVRDNQVLVTTEKLYKEFKVGPQIVRAVSGIDLSLPRGRMAAFMGPSGCGKTTLLQLLGAMEQPTDGKIVVDGVEVSALSGNGQVTYRRDKVGFIFQSYHLLPNLSAVENVMLPMDIRGAPRSQQLPRAKQLLEEVGIGPDRHHHRPFKLSGGEQQRVAIARALANDPPLLLADEPTGNLDRRTGATIVKLLRRLVEEDGKTVLVVTHDPDVAREAHLSFQMADGKIV